MKKALAVLLACMVTHAAVTQENQDTAEQTADQAQQRPGLGITLGAGVTLSDVADKAVVGVRREIVFNKTLGGLHLFGDIYDKVLYDDAMDMRITHFEEEIGYRFGITEQMGLGVFANNINNIYVLPVMTPAPPAYAMTSTVEGIVEPGVKFDGAFSFGGIQATLGVPVLYRQSMQSPDVDPVAGLHPEISWQSAFGLGLYAGAGFALSSGSHTDLMVDGLPFERTEFKISYMAGFIYAELWVYTTLDFEKVNICPTITYFAGPVSVWFSLDMGKIGYMSDFGVCPTAGLTYSF